jgi:hypothetical protein
MRAVGKAILTLAWAGLVLALLQAADQGCNASRGMFLLAGAMDGAQWRKPAVQAAVSALQASGLVMAAFLAAWLWRGRRARPGLTLLLSLLVLAEGLAQAGEWAQAFAMQASAGQWAKAATVALGFVALAAAGWQMQGLLRGLFLAPGDLKAYRHLADPQRRRPVK